MESPTGSAAWPHAFVQAHCSGELKQLDTHARPFERGPTLVALLAVLGHQEQDYRGVLRTLTTLAVRPAAVDALPLVYTARGRNPETYFSSWLLAELGSPMIAMLMSPRRLMPCKEDQSNGRMMSLDTDGPETSHRPHVLVLMCSCCMASLFLVGSCHCYRLMGVSLHTAHSSLASLLHCSVSLLPAHLFGRLVHSTH